MYGRVVDVVEPSPSDGLETIAGGPELAEVCSRVDPAGLSDYDLVGLLQAQARVVAHYQAAMYQTMSVIGDRLTDLGYEEGASPEIATALKLTRAASDAEYRLASGLRRHPQVREALSAGLIDTRRAKVLVDMAVGLEWQTADRVVAAGLVEAPRLTPGQLRARMVKHRLETDPSEAKARYQASIQDRRIVVTANPDGTANLSALNLAPHHVTAIRHRINTLARHAKTPSDTRNTDQRRADVLTDLLLGATTSKADQATVDIVVPLQTLTELADTPGEIPGYGPILADIARQIITEQADGRWEYIVTDQGQPIATGTIRRRPTQAIKRHLRAAKPTCVFPGCRMPARQSDLDHTKPWAKHPTTRTRDLAPLCRHHHQHRHQGWTYTPTPDQTDHIWTSPLGRTYTTSGTDPP